MKKIIFMTTSPVSDFPTKFVHFIIFLLAPNSFNLSLLIIIIILVFNN